MCAALRPLQACPLSGGKFHSPSRAIPCPKSLPLQARLGLLFLFLPFFCPFVLPPAWRGWLSLIQVRRCSGFAHSWVTLAQQGLSGVSLVSFLYSARKIAHRPSQGRVWFHRLFPSLSRWKPGKQQICVHDNLPGAQSQDENLIGKKRFSLPWLSLASPPHFFSRPPSHFSNSVLRSLFFVYSTANFEAAYP